MVMNAERILAGCGARTRLARLCLAWVMLALWLAPGAQMAMARPERIVSLNLCADQYLIRLADPEQIAALSPFARDVEMSFLADEAGAFPITRAAAEAVMTFRPDLVVTHTYQQPQTRLLLERFDRPTLVLPTVQTYDEIREQARLIAEAIGQSARGEALVAEMDGALARLGEPLPGPRPVAVDYQRRGFVTGTRSLLDEIMSRAGLENLARQLGQEHVGPVPLERLIAADPDFLILQGAAERAGDLGMALLQHPALARRYGEDRRLYLPQSLITCGGPSFPHAVAHLAGQVVEKGARR